MSPLLDETKSNLSADKNDDLQRPARLLIEVLIGLPEDVML